MGRDVGLGTHAARGSNPASMTAASSSYRWSIVVEPAPRPGVANPTAAMTMVVHAREWWEAVEEIDVNIPEWSENVKRVTIERLSDDLS